MHDVTQILAAAHAGDEDAARRLFEITYNYLRAIAAKKMAYEAPGQTLQPTALVHEAWLRLGADGQAPWKNRAHFFGAAAEAMRRILVERARRKRAERHGRGMTPLDAHELEIAAPVADEELLSLNESLDRFAAIHPAKAELVKLHYLMGLTFAQASEVLGISEATAKRWWKYSRAWLYRDLTSPGRQPG